MVPWQSCVRTNDPGLISVIEGSLTAAEIPYHVATAT